MPRIYNVEEKKKYINLVLKDGYSYRGIEREFGIPASTLRGWVNTYNEKGLKGLTIKNYKKRIPKPNEKLSDIERLEYENLLLRIENERLKRGYSFKEAQAAKKKK